MTTKNFVCLGKPKKTYRIIIQQRKPKLIERCFMIYDYVGNSNIEKVKNDLREIRGK